jgi:hypothetical protein
MGKLAYEHTDANLNLVYNQIAPGIEMNLQHGQFRELNERANFLERDALSGNTTIAKTFSVSDTLRNFNITPISQAFEYWKGDLAQSVAYGKNKEHHFAGTQKDQRKSVLLDGHHKCKF